MGRLRLVVILVAISAIMCAAPPGKHAPPPCLKINEGKLSPKLAWLQKERLRGALMHRAYVENFPPLYLRRVSEKTTPMPPILLRGQHVILISPEQGQPVTLSVKAVDGRPEFPDTVFALFTPASRIVGNGIVSKGETAKFRFHQPETDRYILLLNPGVGYDNAAEVCVSDGSWVIDGRGRAAYHSIGETSPGTPLQYHILRDMKLAGMNVLMLDFRHFQFSTPDEMKDWVRRLKEWAEFAAMAKMRFIPAVDLGGSAAEVKGWGDAPPGLYIEPKPEQPTAPCPLQRVYWERILLLRGREVAKASLTHPAIVGYGIDPEMYSCWSYGHYMLTGTCFCDFCMKAFLQSKSLPLDPLAKMPTAKERWEWLRGQKLDKDWDKFLEDETCKIATWIREELQAINPDLFFVVYVLDIGNWFCRGLARGLGTERVPVINFAESSYWSGFNERALKQVEKFRSWGAHVLHGGGLYPGSHPPTKPGYLGATCYNFALQTGGYWLWPMDYFLSDWQSKNVYEGQSAQQADYWLTLRQVNAELDKRMTSWFGHKSLFDTLTPHPIWNPEAKKKAEGVEWKTEPFFPVRLAGPAKVYFSVPKRVEQFFFSVCAPGAGNGGEVALLGPEGKIRASVKGELDAPEKLEVAANAQAGIWCVEVKSVPGASIRDLRVRSEGILPYFSPTPDSVLIPIEKASSLIGWWKLDEGQGNLAGDSSGPPPFNGTIAEATWTEGRFGKALSFDGRRSAVVIPHNYLMDNLSEFTVMAWVKVNALPTPHNGGTIVNKGPESPVQHFWLWIGYPPNHSLILEVGNENHRYGVSCGSGKLSWEIGRWYHVAAVFSSQKGKSTARLYRDGVQVGEKTWDEVFNSGLYDLRLGSYGGIHTLNGVLDEVKFFNQALSPETIRSEASMGDKR